MLTIIYCAGFDSCRQRDQSPPRLRSSPRQYPTHRHPRIDQRPGRHIMIIIIMYSSPHDVISISRYYIDICMHKAIITPRQGLMYVFVSPSPSLCQSGPRRYGDGLRCDGASPFDPSEDLPRGTIIVPTIYYNIEDLPRGTI